MTTRKIRYKVQSKDGISGISDTPDGAREIVKMRKTSNGTKTSYSSTLEYSILPFEDDGALPSLDLKYKPGRYPPGDDTSIR